MFEILSIEQQLKEAKEALTALQTELEAVKGENEKYKTLLKWHDENLDDVKNTFAAKHQQDEAVIEKLTSKLQTATEALESLGNGYEHSLQFVRQVARTALASIKEG
jgi:predicted RNase H-like nuclease (RuvC/YqgF family)